jgi:CIC family chloride channel protein
MASLTVGDAMRPVPAPVTTEAGLTEVVDRLVAEGVAALPMVDAEGAYRGIVTLDGAEEQMRANGFDATAADLAQSVPTVRADESLEQALDRLLAYGGSGLPVLSTDDQHVIGWITHHDLLRAYSTAGSPPRPGSPPATAAETPEATTRAAATEAPGPSWLRGFRIVDLEFTADEPPVGERVAALPWPALSLPIHLRRGGLTLALTGDVVLQAGDRITVLVDHTLADDLADRLATPRPEPPPASTGVEPEEGQDDPPGRPEEPGLPIAST